MILLMAAGPFLAWKQADLDVELIEDAAKLQALAEMYPRRALADIITDLLSAALRDLESSLPYERGNKVVGTDEEGDPLYEDVGPTPRYLDLTRKHLNKYQKALKETH